jgi:Zinc dependent phospholipase C
LVLEKTHSDIVDAVYYGLPVDVQQKLNINAMRAGSNDPDEKFKDFRYHSYPKSYGKAKMWLDKGKTAYDNGNYNEASYDYGVASHYISDTFSAPHTVSREAYSDHSNYEIQAKILKPTATYIRGDLNSLMQNGYNQGVISWNDWLQSKNSAIIQKNLNTAASVSFSAIKNSINSKPSPNILSLIFDFILNLFHIKQ